MSFTPTWTMFVHWRDLIVLFCCGWYTSITRHYRHFSFFVEDNVHPFRNLIVLILVRTTYIHLGILSSLFGWGRLTSIKEYYCLLFWRTMYIPSGILSSLFGQGWLTSIKEYYRLLFWGSFNTSEMLDNTWKILDNHLFLTKKVINQIVLYNQAMIPSRSTFWGVRRSMDEGIFFLPRLLNGSFPGASSGRLCTVLPSLDRACLGPDLSLLELPFEGRGHRC